MKKNQFKGPCSNLLEQNSLWIKVSYGVRPVFGFPLVDFYSQFVLYFTRFIAPAFHDWPITKILVLCFNVWFKNCFYGLEQKGR